MLGKNERRVRKILGDFPSIVVDEETYSDGNGSRAIRVQIEENDFSSLKRRLDLVNAEDPYIRCHTLFARDRQGSPIHDEGMWDIHFREIC